MIMLPCLFPEHWEFFEEGSEGEEREREQWGRNRKVTEHNNGHILL